MWAPVIAFLQEQSKPSLIFNPGTIFNVNKTVRLLRNSKISLIAMHKIYMSRKRIWNELKHDLFHNVLKAWPRNRSDKKYGTSYLSLAILSLQINLEIVLLSWQRRTTHKLTCIEKILISNDTRGVSVSLTLCSTSINAFSVVFFIC